MNGDTKMGLGVVALLALCCAGPLILSLLASGAVLGALGAVWAAAHLLLLGGSALLIAGGAWLLARRSIQAGTTPACDVPRASGTTHGEHAG